MMQYQILQRAFTISRNFVVKDNRNVDVFAIRSVWFAFTRRLSFTDAQGNELAIIRQKFWSFIPTCEIYRGDKLYATIRAGVMPSLQSVFDIDIPGHEHYKAEGISLDYTVTRSDTWIARVIGRWAPNVHNYGVEILPGEDDVLILALVVAIDTITRPMRR